MPLYTTLFNSRKRSDSSTSSESDASIEQTLSSKVFAELDILKTSDKSDNIKNGVEKLKIRLQEFQSKLNNSNPKIEELKKLLPSDGDPGEINRLNMLAVRDIGDNGKLFGLIRKFQDQLKEQATSTIGSIQKSQLTLKNSLLMLIH